MALRQWCVFITADGVVQWPAVTFSVRAPTTNPFLTMIDACNEHDRNTVDARTFPWAVIDLGLDKEGTFCPTHQNLEGHLNN